MKAITVPGVAALGPAGPDITDLWRMVRELREAVDELRAANEQLRAQVSDLARGTGFGPY